MGYGEPPVAQLEKSPSFSKTRLAVVSSAFLVFLVFYCNGSTTQWIPRGPNFRIIPQLHRMNFSSHIANQTELLSNTKSFTWRKGSTTVLPVISTAEEQLGSQPRFERKPFTAHIDCSRVVKNDTEYVRSLKRVSRKGESSLQMDCSSIRKRILPPRPLKPTGFGVAFARVVYKDYEFLEDEVRSLFHPENLFCFTLDSKSSKVFHSKMRQMAGCLKNVIIPPKEFDLDSGGHQMNGAHYECLKLLHEKSSWEYVILLQNHDLIIRTPYELVAVYKVLGGANDVELSPCPRYRLPPGWNSTAQQLKLFRNESQATQRQLSAKLRFAKGAVQASLSRAAVSWIVETIKYPRLIEIFNQGKAFVDEQLLPTLQASDELEMPGSFTHKCLDEGYNTDFLSRMSHWAYGADLDCASGKERHAICLLGVEDLPSLAAYPNIMANKFMPDFDYAGIDCIHELIFNRTHLPKGEDFQTDYYQEMVNVKYHRLKTSLNGLNSSQLDVDCQPRGVPWVDWRYP